MKPPMSKTEIAFFDAVILECINECTSCSQLFKDAKRAVSARRAALIADAHVGVTRHQVRHWQCRCEEAATHKPDSEYCEACHTRRPDEVTP